MRLIDADALKKALKSNCTPKLCHDYNTAWCENCCCKKDFEDLIDNAPTVESDYEWGYSEGVHDTERPQGKWIDHGNHIECNQCGIWFLKDHLIRKSFCPECGADTRKGGAE